MKRKPVRAHQQDIDPSSDENDLPEELRSKQYFYEGKLIFTVRPKSLPQNGEIVCEPYISQGAKANQYIRMYSCPSADCTVAIRAEGWTTLREHAREQHNMTLFKHNVANLTSNDRNQSTRCIRMRKNRRKELRSKLLDLYNQRKQESMISDPKNALQSSATACDQPATVSVQNDPEPMSLPAIANTTTASKAVSPMNFPGLLAVAETASLSLPTSTEAVPLSITQVSHSLTEAPRYP
jgi:hypothetical protein